MKHEDDLMSSLDGIDARTGKPILPRTVDVPLPDKPRFIVAEVSHTWVVNQTQGLISMKFETVLEVNRKRGYVLKSFALSQVVDPTGCLLETIVAVFEKETR